MSDKASVLTIDAEEDWDIAVYALRYTLGRMTFAPPTFISWLFPQVDKLPPKAARIMARDIREWQENSHFPESWWTDNDRNQWNELLRRLDERSADGDD